MSVDQMLRAVPVVCIFVLLCAATPSSGQQNNLTIDDIFDPQRRVDFDGSPPQGLVWLDDEHYLHRVTHPRDGEPPLLKVNSQTGENEPLFDFDEMASVLSQFPGIGTTDAHQLSRQSTHLMDPSQNRILLEFTNDLYLYEVAAAQVFRLTRSPQPEEQPSFSPDGQFVAFIRDHDIHVVDVEDRREYTLTSNGTDVIRNGLLDWVYQEEIYGRGDFQGYWWSPDSSRIAYLQLDDTDVPNYTVIDHIPYHPEVEEWRYPKSGDPNPVVSLGIVRSSGGQTTWVDIDRYTPSQPLIVSVDWSPDSQHVVFQVQDREQTWLDLNLATHAGQMHRLFRETTEAWVNVNGAPVWLKDGTFLWMSERTGWKHLYHYGADGNLLREITNGQWEVRKLHGIDPVNEWIYFSGTKRSPIGNDIYRIHLDGSSLTKLSTSPGNHRAQFNPTFSHYIDTWSDINTPPSVRLHEASGTESRVIDANQSTPLSDYRLVKPEFVQVMNRNGFVMEAMIIKPSDFDPTKQYPVYQHVYGGPHTQRVRNTWSGSTFLFWQLLAQRGVIVWVLDNSTASGKGAVSTWPVYQNFGELELQDIEDGLTWLNSQPYVDISRVGIEGWSYGGFMVSYALTHSKSFAMGIAGGPVTDWRNYDTIYTERYMRMPQNNQEGYRRSSPRFSAANLNGALLLVHGSMDENVHMQHTLQFSYELQKAGKPFDMMIYPRSRHQLGGLDLEKHRHTKMLDFVMRHLRPHSTVH
jgi:dipeptidyl-peptidase-4